MLARVNPDALPKHVTACAGVSFFKHVWTPVPAGREEEALLNPLLETRDEDEIEEQPLEVETIPAPEQEPPDAQETVNATPGAINIARTAGINLAEVPGTGKDGRITVDDVRFFLEATTEDD